MQLAAHFGYGDSLDRPHLGWEEFLEILSCFLSIIVHPSASL